MHCRTSVPRLIVVLTLAIGAGSSCALAQGTAFTYQGQLKKSGALVNSATDVQFSVWTSAVGGSQVESTVTNLAVPVSQGLFTSSVDFGVNPYTSNQELYLQIAVRNPAGSGSYVPMGSRQLLTPAPFSLATRGVSVDSSGNIALGQDTPVARLDVVGGSGAANVSAKFSDGVNSTLRIGHPANHIAAIGANTDHTLQLGGFYYDQSAFYPAMTISPSDDGGNVGVGMTNPLVRIDVDNGATIGTSETIVSPADPANQGTKVSFGYAPQPGCGPGADFDGMRILVVPGTNGCGNSTDIQFFTDECNTSCPREVMRINGTGNVGIGTDSPDPNFRLDVSGNVRCFNLTQTSGREFKQNIAPITGALDSIMKLHGVTYAWNDKAPQPVRGAHDIGFIADEMNAVLPDIVAKDENGKPFGIDYGKITPVAVEAIKQLKGENDQLKARLEKVEALLARQAAKDAK